MKELENEDSLNLNQDYPKVSLVRVDLKEIVEMYVVWSISFIDTPVQLQQLREIGQILSKKVEDWLKLCCYSS